jgi:hypothetical protein
MYRPANNVEEPVNLNHVKVNLIEQLLNFHLSKFAPTKMCHNQNPLALFNITLHYLTKSSKVSSDIGLPILTLSWDMRDLDGIMHIKIQREVIRALEWLVGTHWINSLSVDFRYTLNGIHRMNKAICLPLNPNTMHC